MNRTENDQNVKELKRHFIKRYTTILPSEQLAYWMLVIGLKRF